MAGSLNPNIKTIEVGIRTLRTATIYPLSMADQLKVIDTIKGGIVSLASTGAGQGASAVENLLAVDTLLGLIRDNIEKIIEYVTDKDDRITMEELTNEQLSELTTIIYEVSFEKALGNFTGLFDRIKTAFQPKRPSQPSVNGTDTDLMPST